jgi:hypothetical protein
MPSICGYLGYVWKELLPDETGHGSTTQKKTQISPLRMVRNAKNPGAFVADNDRPRPFELALADVVIVPIPARRIGATLGSDPERRGG